jgi:hypothetical protein
MGSPVIIRKPYIKPLPLGEHYTLVEGERRTNLGESGDFHPAGVLDVVYRHAAVWGPGDVVRDLGDLESQDTLSNV